MLLGQNGILYVSFQSKQPIKNAIVEIPIPAGFELDTTNLSCNLKENELIDNSICPLNRHKEFNRFELKAGMLILYYDEISPLQKHFIEINFTPKTVGQFKFLPARIYAYYDPYDGAYSKPASDIAVEYVAP